jgi:hypothetical protein
LDMSKEKAQTSWGAFGGPSGSLRGPTGGALRALWGPFGACGRSSGHAPPGGPWVATGGLWGQWGALGGPLGAPGGRLRDPWGAPTTTTYTGAGDAGGWGRQGDGHGGLGAHRHRQGSHQASRLKSKDLDELGIFCKIWTLLTCPIHQK